MNNIVSRIQNNSQLYKHSTVILDSTKMLLVVVLILKFIITLCFPMTVHQERSMIFVTKSFLSFQKTPCE